MARPLKVSAKEAARLEAAFGKQDARTTLPMNSAAAAEPALRPRRTMATYLADRKAHPEEYEKDPPGYAAVHHLERPVTCRRCPSLVVLLVQCYGAGPCSIGEPVCLTCGAIERAIPRKARQPRRTGKKSRTRGTDLVG